MHRILKSLYISIFIFLSVPLLCQQIKTSDIMDMEDFNWKCCSCPQRLAFYMEGNCFLFPIIENQLNGLKRYSKDTTNYFSRIIPLNRYFENNESIFQRRTLLSFYTDTSFIISKETEMYLEKFSDQLLNFDIFLYVKANLIESIIEYQFSLYNVIKHIDPSGPEIPFFDLSKPIKTTAFFIDPKDINYQKKILNGLKQVIPCTNYKPIINILINDYTLYEDTNNSVFYVGLNDSISLNLNETFDFDSPKEDITYDIVQVNSKGGTHYLDYNKIHFDKNSSFQYIKFRRLGDFFLKIRAYDGINYSTERIIHFRVIKKPEISLEKNKINRS